MTQENPIQPKTVADATELVYETADGTVHRTVYEPITDSRGSHERTEYVWNGCSWRICGSEAIELIDAPVDPGDSR